MLKFDGVIALLHKLGHISLWALNISVPKVANACTVLKQNCHFPTISVMKKPHYFKLHVFQVTSLSRGSILTAQKMKFSIKDFFS